VNRLRELLSRLRGLFAGSGRLDEEIAGHLALLASEYERTGLSPEEAQRRARLDFGGITQMREEYREQRGLALVDTFFQDLRYAGRQLRRSPGFAAAAVLTLALGIGANAAIYQVLDAVVFRSLPVRHPEQLVLLHLSGNGKTTPFSYPLYREMAARQQVAAGIIATSNSPLREAILRAAGGVETVNAALVSGNYCDVLGVAAATGRCFHDADDRAAAPVAIISHAFWQRHFGGGPAIGTTLEINRASLTVIGIMPPSFFGDSGDNAPDLWLPMGMQPRVLPTDWLDAPAYSWLEVTARLRPGASPAQTASALTALYRKMPDLGSPDLQVQAEPANRVLAELNAKTAHPLYVLIGISAAVLLIACCNLANLLLGRATARTHEIGFRLALGAGRGRIIRHLLTESFLLCALGTAAAAVLASWGSRALVRVEDWKVTLDASWRVPGFIAVVAILATLLFGLAPAMAATHLDLLPALRSNRRTTAGESPRQFFGKILIVVQIATSLLLLSGAALLGRTLWNLQHQDFGFSRSNLLMIDLPLEFRPGMVSRSVAQRPALYERLQSLPGVRSVAISACGMLSSWQKTGYVSTPARPLQKSDFIRYTYVTPGYFEALGIRMVSGRGIDQSDREGAPRTLVISETAARILFGRANPLGQMVSLSKTFEAKNAAQVVGVARDVRFLVRDPYAFQVYLPFSQAVIPMTEALVRTAGDPAAMANTVRAAIHDQDSTLAVGDIKTVQSKFDSGLRRERMMALLTACFGLLALVLTSVGVYGVIAYSVERRTQEIGIRLALGAARRQVAWMVLREMGLLVGVSLAMGLGATLAASRLIRSLLYGVVPNDAATLAIAACVLAGVSILAAWLPARRASRLDPMDALRQE
jgi:predicted permease